MAPNADSAKVRAAQSASEFAKMTAHTPPRFWQQHVAATRPVDASGMTLFRRRAFPADGGPGPWLDQPDAEAQIDARLAAGELTADEAELCRKWSRDGYLILEGFYDRA